MRILETLEEEHIISFHTQLDHRAVDIYMEGERWGSRYGTTLTKADLLQFADELRELAQKLRD